VSYLPYPIAIICAKAVMSAQIGSGKPWNALNLSWRREHASVQSIKIPHLQLLVLICRQLTITCLEVVWNILSDNERNWEVIKSAVVFWIINLTSDLIENWWDRRYLSIEWYFWQTNFPLISYVLTAVKIRIRIFWVARILYSLVGVYPTSWKNLLLQLRG